MKNAFRYANQVWLTAVLVVPIVFVIWHFVGTEEIVGNVSLGSLMLMIAFGALLSIPSWLLLGFIAWWINDFEIKLIAKKAILTLISFLLTHFSVLFISTSRGDFSLTIIYWAAITFGLWVYRLNPTLPEPSAAPLDQLP